MSKRILVVYDNFCGIGGEPKVILELAKGLKASLATTYIRKDIWTEFEKVNVISLSSKVECQKKKLTRLRRIQKFLQLDLSDYDVVITGGRAAMVIALKKNRPHLIHYEQPPSLLDSMFYKVHEVKSLHPRLFLLKYYINNIVRHVDTLVSNSKFVREAIYKYYNLNSKVIYPPVDISKFYSRNSKDFFLSVQRITPAKRVEIQLKAFRKLPNEQLIIVGPPTNKEYFKKLQEIAPKNVKFLVNVSDEKLVDLYAACKATIQTSKAEPFGLVPIESMASGKPCIAVNEGGFKETIIHGKTGILVNKPYIDNLIKVIKEFDKYTFKSRMLRNWASCFSLDKFICNFRQLVDDIC